MVVSFIKKKMTEEEIEERAKKYDQEQEERRVKKAAYINEWAKAYYRKNHERMDEQTREYRIQNREKLNEQQKKRCQKKKIRDVFKYDLIKFCEKHPSDFYKTGLKINNMFI